MAAERNYNASHRARVRKRFLAHGLSCMEEQEQLELLLFYAVPRVDTKPIAVRLLERFGSLANVLDAPKEALETVEGVGEQCSTFLKLLPAMASAYGESKSKTLRLYDTESAGAYLCTKYIGRTKEALTVLALDSNHRVLVCQVVQEGNIEELPMALRKIVAIAVQYDADALVLAHNHPSGQLLPSEQDITATYQVAEALRPIGVGLEDHFVIAGDNFLSLRKAGFLQD